MESILDRHRVKYTLEWFLSGDPFFTPPGTLSDAVARAVRDVTGLTPSLSTGGGTSDGRFIAPTGAQVVELGVINASIHKVNEHVVVEDITRLQRIYERCWNCCWPEPVSLLANVGSTRRRRIDARGGRPAQLTTTPAIPSTAHQISTHHGMLRPRNDQLMVAHSPEPVSTLRITSVAGNTSNM